MQFGNKGPEIRFVSTVLKYCHERRNMSRNLDHSNVFSKEDLRFLNEKLSLQINKLNIMQRYHAFLAIKLPLRNTFCPSSIRQEHALLFIYSTNIIFAG